MVSNPTQATYTAPTLDANGKAIAAGAISRYEVGIGTSSGVYTRIVQDAPEGTAQQVTPVPQDLIPGNYFASVRAVNAIGAGAWGAEVAFAVTAAVPGPPTGFVLS